MIGSLIGAGLQIASSIAGGISAARKARKARQNVEAQRDRNQSWYDRRYNEDATQSATAQRVMSMTMDNIRRRNKAAAGAQAVMGGTDESVANAKAQNNEALAEAASRIAANGEARKDQIEQQYLAKDDQYRQQLSNIEINGANAMGQAVQGAAGAAGSLASVIDGVDSRFESGKGDVAQTTTPDVDTNQQLQDTNILDTDWDDPNKRYYA